MVLTELHVCIQQIVWNLVNNSAQTLRTSGAIGKYVSIPQGGELWADLCYIESHGLPRRRLMEDAITTFSIDKTVDNLACIASLRVKLCKAELKHKNIQNQIMWLAWSHEQKKLIFLFLSIYEIAWVIYLVFNRPGYRIILFTLQFTYLVINISKYLEYIY